jgi:hypothetical protein
MKHRTVDRLRDLRSAREALEEINLTFPENARPRVNHLIGNFRLLEVAVAPRSATAGSIRPLPGAVVVVNPI